MEPQFRGTHSELVGWFHPNNKTEIIPMSNQNQNKPGQQHQNPSQKPGQQQGSGQKPGQQQSGGRKPGQQHQDDPNFKPKDLGNDNTEYSGGT